jgi:putative ABC transport system substrate-binding protein
MKRRAFIASLTGGLLAAPLTAEAQPQGKVWRIGFASLLTREQVMPWFRELEAGLRERGYVPGRNLEWEIRFSAGHPEQLQRLMAEIVASRVDAILAPINANVIAAKQATSSIPIVMVNALDPVGNGLVASLARPGGNVTGSTFEVAPEMYAKNVELLALVLTQRPARLGILWNPTHPGVRPNLVACMDAAPRLGVSLQPFEARTPDDLPRAIAAMRSSNVVGFILLNEPMYLAQRDTITTAATTHRLPAIYPMSLYTEAGGLISYGPNLFKLWRDAARYFDKIFKGTKPEDIPIELPSTLELIINLKTAKALGLTIPPSLLARADQVIQ